MKGLTSNRNDFDRRKYLLEKYYKKESTLIVKVGLIFVVSLLVSNLFKDIEIPLLNYKLNNLWVLVGFWAMYSLSKREGIKEGFHEGHQAGYDDRISDERGLTDKEAAEFNEMELLSNAEEE